jgi:MFS transporter, DHA1 family, solute carrier family 18 (vesicular amine transporter), member 1/2
MEGRRSLSPLVAVGFALFTDAFLYEVVIPLAPLSPAGITSTSDIASLYCAYALGVVLLTPLCGIVSDRIGRKNPLIVGAIAQLIATFIFASAGSYWILMLARIIQGGASSAAWTAGLAVIAERYPNQRVQKMGLAMLGTTMGALMAPLAGGALYDMGGYLAPFWVSGLIAFVDLILRLTLIPHDQNHIAVPNAMPVLFRNRAVLAAALVAALIACGWGLIEPDVPAFLIDKAGASSTVVGLLFTLSGVAYGLAATPVERLTEWFGRRFAISLGLTIMAVGMPFLVIYPSVILVGTALCLVTIAYACAMNPLLTELADAVDRCAAGAYASVYAIFNIAYAIGTLIGGVVAGPVASHFSVLTASLSIGVILLLSLPLLRWGLISVSAAPAGQTRPDKA